MRRIAMRLAPSIRDRATIPMARISISTPRASTRKGRLSRELLPPMPRARPPAETATKKRLVRAAEMDHVAASIEVRWLYSALRILNLSSRSATCGCRCGSIGCGLCMMVSAWRDTIFSGSGGIYGHVGRFEGEPDDAALGELEVGHRGRWDLGHDRHEPVHPDPRPVAVDLDAVCRSAPHVARAAFGFRAVE